MLLEIVTDKDRYIVLNVEEFIVKDEEEFFMSPYEDILTGKGTLFRSVKEAEEKRKSKRRNGKTNLDRQ